MSGVRQYHSMRRTHFNTAAVTWFFVLGMNGLFAAESPAKSKPRADPSPPFFKQHCFKCHGAVKTAFAKELLPWAGNGLFRVEWS